MRLLPGFCAEKSYSSGLFPFSVFYLSSYSDTHERLRMNLALLARGDCGVAGWCLGRLGSHSSVDGEGPVWSPCHRDGGVGLLYLWLIHASRLAYTQVPVCINWQGADGPQTCSTALRTWLFPGQCTQPAGAGRRLCTPTTCLAF